MIANEYWITGLITLSIVGLCVLLHYEALRLISDRLPTPKHHHRQRIVLLIICLMMLHILQVWIFGFAYYGLLRLDGFGELVSSEPIMLVDCIYYSAAVYSTLGFGDIYPIGPIRTMTGTEAITGLTLITWSASYTFLEMLRTWNDQ